MPSSFLIRTSNFELSAHPLEHQVMLPIHPQPPINLLRSGIAPIDVQPDAANRRISGLTNVRIQPSVDTAPAKLRIDVHALDPPDHTVAPIAPFVRDEQRRDDAAAGVGDEIAAARGIVEYGLYA